MADHPFATDVYRPDLGEEIELFMLDPTPIDSTATVMYFCSSVKHNAAVKWKNKAGSGWVDYTPIPIEAEGFEATGQGTLPRPKIRISNVGALGSLVGPLFSVMQSYDDLLGAKVTRYKTLGKYLYGNTTQDYDAHWPPDVYLINQKVTQNPLYVEWELAPYFDCQGIKLPKRLVLRDVCQLRYRVWDSSNSEWIYDDTENACPLQNRLLTPDGNEFDFSETGSWDLSGGWTISDGKLNHASGHGGGADDSAFIWTYLKPGISLYCEFEATVSAGTCDFGLYRSDIPGYGGWGDGKITISSTGTKSTLVVTTWNYQHAIIFWPNDDFVGSIDNLVVDIYADQHNTCWSDPAKDLCAHTYLACQARWHRWVGSSTIAPSPYNQSLPFLAFPSVSKVRV